MKRERVGVYPGSFDPVTFGHIDVAERSLMFFDRVVVAVTDNRRKDFLFAIEERVAFLRRTFRNRRGITVDSFDGLLADYLRTRGYTRIIRGLRAVSDFEYELQMALTNRTLSRDIDTIFLMPREEYFYISSSIVKEIASLGGDVGKFVPPAVEDALKKTFKKRR